MEITELIKGARSTSLGATSGIWRFLGLLGFLLNVVARDSIDRFWSILHRICYDNMKKWEGRCAGNRSRNTSVTTRGNMKSMDKWMKYIRSFMRKRTSSEGSLLKLPSSSSYKTGRGFLSLFAVPASFKLGFEFEFVLIGESRRRQWMSSTMMQGFKTILQILSV